MRSRSSRIGASTPICAAVGSTPISAVAPPISSMVRASVRLRPMRSPTWPKTKPPIGRTTKPTANVANDSSVPTNELWSGKNALLKTRLAAVA
jgi:hypothetical protein